MVGFGRRDGWLWFDLAGVTVGWMVWVGNDGSGVPPPSTFAPGPGLRGEAACDRKYCEKKRKINTFTRCKRSRTCDEKIWSFPSGI